MPYFHLSCKEKRLFAGGEWVCLTLKDMRVVSRAAMSGSKSHYALSRFPVILNLRRFLKRRRLRPSALPVHVATATRSNSFDFIQLDNTDMGYSSTELKILTEVLVWLCKLRVRNPQLTTVFLAYFDCVET